MSGRAARRAQEALVTGLMAAVLAVLLFPIYWITTMAFKDFIVTTQIPPAWIFRPTLVHFENLFRSEGFGRPLVNSVVIALSSTALSLVLGTPAAYALARFQFRLSGPVALFTLGVRMVPTFVMVIPLFLLINQARIIGPHWAVICAHTLIALPLVIWLMRSYFGTVPPELEAAAMIDGCTRLGAIVRVSLPVAAPGLVAAAVFSLIGSWNDFVYALILGGESAKTMPVTLGGLVTTSYRTEWGLLAAGGTLTMMPVIAFALLVRRYFFSGLTLGAID
jgi:multiple sugar transport system permease protein